MKKIDMIGNAAGGLDLLVERDSGNTVRILTGKHASSLEFWHRLAEQADAAIAMLSLDIYANKDKE